MALFLFDIDMTLVDPAGAGREALERAFSELLGIDRALEGMAFAGRTDSFIVQQALQSHGRDDVSLGELLPTLTPTYVRHLAEVLPNRPTRVLPGAHELVAALAIVPGASLGIATGNLRAAAELKLDHFGLSLHLRDGGFGEDSADRAEVVAAAISRLTPEVGESAAAPEPVVVIGDTPHDIAAAKANSCTAVAVATGFSSVSELRSAGADLVYSDFGDAEAVFTDLVAVAGINAL